MKIWNGYGSEHSMKLVLIGRFKEERDAERAQSCIEQLKTQAMKEDNYDLAQAKPEDQIFSDEMLSLLLKLKLNTLGPADFGQFLSDYRLEHQSRQIKIETDEAEVSAFMKLFVEAGAKVEIYSAHDYPQDLPDTEQMDYPDA
jgi:hypothetical protein